MHWPAACSTQLYLEIKAHKPLQAAQTSRPRSQFSAQVSKLTTGQTTGSVFIISITPCLLLTTQIWRAQLLDTLISADAAWAGRLEFPLSGPAIVRRVVTVNTIISIIASVPALATTFFLAGRQLSSTWLNYTGRMLFSGEGRSHHWIAHLRSHSLSLSQVVVRSRMQIDGLLKGPLLSMTPPTKKVASLIFDCCQVMGGVNILFGTADRRHALPVKKIHSTEEWFVIRAWRPPAHWLEDLPSLCLLLMPSPDISGHGFMLSGPKSFICSLPDTSVYPVAIAFSVLLIAGVVLHFKKLHNELASATRHSFRILYFGVVFI